jgi:hypothetical protein
VQSLAVQHARGVRGGEGAHGPGAWGDGGGVDVQPGVLLLPLGAAVLEPDLHLHTNSRRNGHKYAGRNNSVQKTKLRQMKFLFVGSSLYIKKNDFWRKKKLFKGTGINPTRRTERGLMCLKYKTQIDN